MGIFFMLKRPLWVHSVKIQDFFWDLREINLEEFKTNYGLSWTFEEIDFTEKIEEEKDS